MLSFSPYIRIHICIYINIYVYIHEYLYTIRVYIRVYAPPVIVDVVWQRTRVNTFVSKQNLRATGVWGEGSLHGDFGMHFRRLLDHFRMALRLALASLYVDFRVALAGL